MKALAEHGARADTSTGSTPRKRVWQYVDQWELTKSRAELLQTWREAGSDTFLAEHQPLPEVELDEEDVDAMIVDQDFRSPLSETHRSESPTTVSLASSVSSTMALPPPRLIAVAKKGVGSQPKIPLADTRNVYTTRRRGR
jgi:kinesin family protein 11